MDRVLLCRFCKAYPKLTEGEASYARFSGAVTIPCKYAMEESIGDFTESQAIRDSSYPVLTFKMHKLVVVSGPYIRKIVEVLDLVDCVSSCKYFHRS